MPFRPSAALLLFALGGPTLAAEVSCPADAVAVEDTVGGGPAAWCELEEDRSLFHGPYRSWHPNGTLGIEETYVRGKADGRAAYRWASGNRQAEGQYRDGRREGWWTFWDKNGVKEGKVRFQDGKPVAGRLPKWTDDWDGSPSARRPVSAPAADLDAAPQEISQ